ncbi:TEF transcription factor, PAR bZIP family member b isoform X2 [Genypterus blacodes]|uniref:TEF transcription factor, PAR bZIP family member b isoform X2 n=1 Tax=Genypterus blacodes TaxID=154954 RepID=UPI003F7589A4
MPGKTAVAVALLQPSAKDAKATPHKSFPFVLKKIMDIPPPNILEEGDDEIDKEKLCSPEEVEVGGAVAPSVIVGGGPGSVVVVGGGGVGVSASLTPAIWEKTIPYDGETFHLEYMDLDEFLLENGIPVSLEEEELHKSLSVTLDEGNGRSITKVIATATITSTTTPAAAAAPVSASASSPSAAAAAAAATSEPEDEDEEEVTVTTLQPAKMEEEDEPELEEEQEPEQEEEEEEESAEVPDEEEEKENKTDAIEVDVNFQPDPTDLVLSSVPGGELFNPRKHKFSEDELKPQPMIKKAKKVFVPDEKKDEKYWCRRKKNNVAAKRSRDARRLKENQITVRASFLERENAALRQQVAELRKDCGRCKNTLARYEARYGPL